MKACRVCGRLFPEDAVFCQADGQELSRVSETPMPGDTTDELVGQLLCGRYLVFRVVADGGMGRVYEGLDQEAGRHVALKVLHPEVAGDGVSVERFKREYEVSHSLPHQHIVEVTDFQPLGESYLLVMEFLVGEELRAVLKREKVISPERVVRMVSQIAIGLDEAHRRQFIHRDLKPDNVFLCQTQAGDIAKLLDFGSVKDRKRGAKQLTVLGTTIGSPYYMSPEQAQALDTLDQRADVWALTAVVYECITGTVPFKGNNGPSILIEILRSEPTAPSSTAKTTKYPVPRTVDRVIARGLQKTAALRIASIGQLADELGRAYGLTGDHLDWAKTPEAELGRVIQERLPALLDSVGNEPEDAVVDFFGESSALGEAPASNHHAVASNEQSPMPEGPRSPEKGAAHVPAPRSAKATTERPPTPPFVGAATESTPPAVPLNRTPRWFYLVAVVVAMAVAAFWLFG